ncbi:MAG TPA: iron-sulfur cluster repair di-iron protein [Ignavibacteriaceae bacterium]|jgi:regulator of cell morphogenesis and NO signaling|nr:MAG: Iron-sulfur cluster repair protein ScdA [Ignavibacteria bacterium ADurb.Bin266]OQY71921.1 MAG: iron-sulfur cluster repair di-iron protein [Ignavibacteriales bacterium UTCHB2]HQF42855.1 iron-sulfur cluster repair di-iron protein [Ignavibacteriaceae bacterium]HQI39558.1 iron-sulfur cluster repair di-iron protein [Ignavibacteriaceae bacterium]HQJ45664.1 iron-sulfur cluster repair di-iron protein [Ignavibacteriaceae bacterium]
MNNYLSKSIGSIVADDFRTATIFNKYKIDFCCNGHKNFGEVCEAKKIDIDALTNELDSVINSTQKANVDFQSWPLDLLADYIEKKHHRYIEQRSPEIKAYLDKLCKVHGNNHPELFKINELFSEGAGELAQHMKKEELMLFPKIKGLVKLVEKNDSEANKKPGSVSTIVQAMIAEHENEGVRFKQIAQLTDNYSVPADGCSTYNVTFSLLKEFEEDLYMHIHLENNILFPGTIELEKKVNQAV